MRIETFLMERMQSTWENRVEWNLSESGVHPMSVNELLQDDPESLEQLQRMELLYSQSNGTIELRERIAALYPGATVDNVLVTNGTSEANFLVTFYMMDSSREMVFLLPNYMQIWGLGRALAKSLRPFHLKEENRWGPDLEELKKALSGSVEMVAVCNPNNPTGAIFSEEEMNEILRLVEQKDCWLLSDEVYQGAEREGPHAPSFWGRYDRVIITNGLSKAYGLPGLRIGWIVAPADLIARLWSYHDYTSIAPGTLSDWLARIALQKENRERILARTRKILQTNFPVLQQWMAEHEDTFLMVPPKAGAIAYLKYRLDINSTRLIERLLHEKSLLIVPGDHFGMDGYVRIGYGPPADYLRKGLDRFNELLEELGSKVEG